VRASEVVSTLLLPDPPNALVLARSVENTASRRRHSPVSHSSEVIAGLISASPKSKPPSEWFDDPQVATLRPAAHVTRRE
jgi:hypothetical protein